MSQQYEKMFVNCVARHFSAACGSTDEGSFRAACGSNFRIRSFSRRFAALLLLMSLLGHEMPHGRGEAPLRPHAREAPDGYSA